MSQQGALEKYNTLVSNNDFVFAVFYRGHWCPFCLSHLGALQSLVPEIESAGGRTVIITSEPEEPHLAATRKSTGYSGEAIVDVENLIATDLKKRGILEVAITERKGYEHGMAQPAILVQTKEGKVLEKWAIVPSMMNMGGAKDRPDLAQVWENVQDKLKGGEGRHKKYALLGMWTVMKKMMCFS